MLRFEGDGLEDEQVERALREVETSVRQLALPFRFDKKVAGLLSKRKGRVELDSRWPAGR